MTNNMMPPKGQARSRFAQIREQGRRPVGAFVMSIDDSNTRIYADVGYDWVAIDREHGIMDNTHMRAHILAAEAYGAVPIVRVLENNQSLIQQAMDAGAQGVIVPKIATATEAASAVRATRYQAGGRGRCNVVPAASFISQGWAKYSDSMNENAIMIALIETARGVDNIEEIVATDGVDFIFFGLGDLSQDLNISMEDDLDQLVEIWEKVAHAAHNHGVMAGAPLGYGFDDLADFGTLDADLTSLRSAAEARLAAIGANIDLPEMPTPQDMR